jgi:hypothetical protein
MGQPFGISPASTLDSNQRGGQHVKLADAFNPREEEMSRPDSEKKTPRNGPSSYGISRLGARMAFLKNGACSKTLMHVLDRELHLSPSPEEAAAHPLAGGLMQGYQCGMIWGATLAAGAEAHRRFGAGERAQRMSIQAAVRLVDAFRTGNGHINCLEITETDPKNGWQVFLKFFVKGGMLGCMRRAADYAPTAFDNIHAAFDDTTAASCCQTSCSATLARRSGASEHHVTMAAGLAGGIGLSGGACGALGAAIWLTGMRERAQGTSQKAINAKIDNIVQSFLKTTEYQFECRDIVGRCFENAGDHGAYVHVGGCAEIIEMLAAGVSG